MLGGICAQATLRIYKNPDDESSDLLATSDTYLYTRELIQDVVLPCAPTSGYGSKGCRQPTTLEALFKCLTIVLDRTL